MFTTNGRIGRLRYLGWSMAMTLCFLVIMGLGFLLGETVGVAVTALASIAFIVIAVMIGVQRCMTSAGRAGSGCSTSSPSSAACSAS